MNYQQLVSVVSDYLARGDLDSIIPSFISLAEARLNRNLRARVMEKTITITADGANVPFPDDFLEMRAIYLDGNPAQEVRYLAPDAFTRYRDGNGQPAYYTVIGNDIVLAPAPDSQMDLMLVYYARVTPLSAANPTNAVLENFPDLYLYATLIESSAYSRSSIPLETWRGFYSEALRDVQQSENRARFGKQLRAAAPRH